MAALALTAGVATFVGKEMHGRPLNAVSVVCLVLWFWGHVADALHSGEMKAPYASAPTERATDPTGFRVLVGIYTLVAAMVTAVGVAVLVWRL